MTKHGSAQELPPLPLSVNHLKALQRIPDGRHTCVPFRDANLFSALKDLVFKCLELQNDVDDSSLRIHVVGLMESVKANQFGEMDLKPFLISAERLSRKAEEIRSTNPRLHGNIQDITRRVTDILLNCAAGERLLMEIAGSVPQETPLGKLACTFPLYGYRAA